MKSLSHATRLAAATGSLIVASLALQGAPAFADHTRQHTCEQAGGVFTAGATANADRCVVTTTTAVTGPFGAPTTTFSEPVPDGTSPIFIDTPSVPAGAPTVEEETRNVGDPVVVQTFLLGQPEVSSVDRDAGVPLSVPVVVPGEPSTETRTEQGTPTSTQAPGTRNCERVNNANARQPVERCERTVVTTTTTPTEEVTTVTTPQERVTTTTQPRETVTTTRTPSTEVFTSTQQQEQCTTTTQPTEFTRTTTQTTTRTQTISYQQRTITTTTTSTFRYQGAGPTAALVLVVFPIAANPRIQTSTSPAEPFVSETTVAGPPNETVETLPGESVVTTTCTPAEPEVTRTEGETTYTQVEAVTPASSVVTVEREQLDPLVAETRRPGEPVVTTTVNGTGQTCTNNPSNAEQRQNRC